MTGVFERLTRFVQQVFKTTVEIFLEALKLSPGAQGYVLGSITEFLLKEKLEQLGFEVKRIGMVHFFRKIGLHFWYLEKLRRLGSHAGAE